MGNGHHEGQLKEVARGRISLGIGGNSAKTDRATQLSSQQGLWNVFNQGMGTGEAGQAKGNATLDTATADLGGAKSYFKSLMAPGRTTATQQAAPAIASATDQASATRGTGAQFGTNRGGGGAGPAREAGPGIQKTMADIVNQNMGQGRAAGAAGLTQVAGQEADIGKTQLANSLSRLGLSQEAITAIMSNSTASREVSSAIHDKEAQGYGQAAGDIILRLAKVFGSKT